MAVTDDNGTWKANFENNAGYENFLNMYKDMVDDGDNPLEADTDSMMSAGQVGITVGGTLVTAGLDTAGGGLWYRAYSTGRCRRYEFC